MTKFIVFICERERERESERVHKRPSVIMINTSRYIFLKFLIDIKISYRIQSFYYYELDFEIHRTEGLTLKRGTLKLLSTTYFHS